MGQINKNEILAKLREALKSKDKVFKDMHIKPIEPLLQHYGIQTTWLDLVDNIWIALWFSCYKATSTGRYLSFEKRLKRKEGKSQRYAYIILISADLSNSKVVGLVFGRVLKPNL